MFDLENYKGKKWVHFKILTTTEEVSEVPEIMVN